MYKPNIKKTFAITAVTLSLGLGGTACGGSDETDSSPSKAVNTTVPTTSSDTAPNSNSMSQHQTDTVDGIKYFNGIAYKKFQYVKNGNEFILLNEQVFMCLGSRLQTLTSDNFIYGTNTQVSVTLDDPACMDDGKLSLGELTDATVR